MSLTCVAPSFPTPWRPEAGSFLKSLATVMHDQGIDLQVVAPVNVTGQLRDRIRHRAGSQTENAGYPVVRPLMLQLPLSVVGATRVTRRVNEILMRQAVERGLDACPRPVTAVYGHFWIGGYAAQRWCRVRGVPYFVELQESGIREFLNPAGDPRELSVLEQAAGIVTVSKDNERFVTEVGLAGTTPVRYLPNGFDARRFTPLDRAEARRTLRLPAEGSIVVFAGAFIERKGPLRVLDALNQLADVKGVFLGRGPQVPRGAKVLYAGLAPDDELPAWFSAADVFVLPSLAEGLANVTVEAMACGLPLVVSDRPFNRDFLTDREAVFVDPDSARSIAQGLASVLECESRRHALGAAALTLSSAFTLQGRAERIRDFVADPV